MKRLSAILATVVLAGGALWAGPSGAAVGRIRTGDNYRLMGFDAGNPLRGKNAPGLAANPANPNHIVEIQMDLNEQSCEWNTSTDGGLTWPAGGVLMPPAGWNTEEPCPTGGHGANFMDAGVRFGSGNNVYVVWGSLAPGQTVSSLLLSKSTDGGQTFPPATLVAPPVGSPLSDHGFPKIAVRPGAGIGGTDQLLLTSEGRTPLPGDHASTGSVRTIVSNDGGQTFGPIVQASPVPRCTNPPAAFDPANPATSAANACENPYGATEHTKPVFGPNGEMYVGWRTSSTPLFAGTDPLRNAGFIRVAESLDNGQTWTSTNAIHVTGAPGFGGSAFPELNINPTTGALYLVWAQDPHLYGDNPGFSAQDHFMHNRSQVYFIRSTDGNTTWGGLKRISETPISPLPEPDRLNPETQTRHPNIYVAPDGRVDIVWQDRRHAYRTPISTHAAYDEARLGDTYYSYSENGGTSFSPNRRITDRHMNNDVGFDYRFSTYWDFGPVLIHQGTDNILFAWMDSREGNFENDTQDIYLAKTNLRASRGVAPVRSVEQLLARYTTGPSPVLPGVPGNLGDPPSQAAAMSQLAAPGGGEAVLAGTFASRPWTQVVLAPQNDPASMLAGGVLARANVGPLLLSGPNKLPPASAAEAARMQPRARDDEALVRSATDFTATAGSTTATCPSCNFVAGDVGSLVRNTNLPPDTVISSVNSPSSVVLSNPANTSSTTPSTFNVTFAPQVGAFVIGNTNQIKPQVVDELAAATGLLPSQIKRLDGTPAEIARKIAAQMDRRTATQKTAGAPAFDAAVIVNPASPDSAAVSTLAAHRRLPVLFTNQNSIPAETSAALTQFNINKTLVIGGPDDVSPGVEAALPNPTRLGGADQFATSIAVLQESIARGLPTNQIFVANGDDPRHGSMLGSSTARIGGLLLLTPGGNTGDSQATAGALGLDNRLDRHIAVPKLSGTSPGTTTTTVGV